jgi:hypothetical protein
MVADCSLNGAAPSMSANSKRRDLVARGISSSGVTDDVLVGEFEAFPGSYNAEAAFSVYLSVACEIALQRPHLFARLLPKAIDAAYCMGVDSAEAFIEYASVRFEQDASREPKHQQFSQAAIAYFHQSIDDHVSTIQSVLKQG